MNVKSQVIIIERKKLLLKFNGVMNVQYMEKVKVYLMVSVMFHTEDILL